MLLVIRDKYLYYEKAFHFVATLRQKKSQFFLFLLGLENDDHVKPEHH